MLATKMNYNNRDRKKSPSIQKKLTAINQIKTRSRTVYRTVANLGANDIFSVELKTLGP